MSNETIVAIATPPGRGGVAIIRLSGQKAYSIALQINANKPLPPRKAVFCSFFKNKSELVDQGLMLYFKAPHSFTGEDIVEIHTHGSPIVLDLILNESVACGARLARPGEFSERAFLNDKIDLLQAEAIADLIHASSETSARMALKTLQGEFSEQIHLLNQQIINLRLYVEAAIDFPDEEIDFLSDGYVFSLLDSILRELGIIRQAAYQGTIIKEGLTLVLAGRPNAGKSTIINRLAKREVAIVTEIAGTTRDIMREHVLLDDIPLHIVDTAGLRQSEDIVEREGIKRALQAIKTADCVLLVADINHPNEVNELRKELDEVLSHSIPIITIFNKIDMLSLKPKTENQCVFLSAKLGEGIEELKLLIKQVVGYQPTEGQFLARRRHLLALDDANNYLLQGKKQLTLHKAGELLAEDLRQAHRALGEITGEFTTDDLLGKIFSSFCIGK